jgi:hypothetical protein
MMSADEARASEASAVEAGFDEDRAPCLQVVEALFYAVGFKA